MFRIALACRAKTRKVAWNASSASASLPATLRHTSSTMGPWRRNRLPKAAFVPAARESGEQFLVRQVLDAVVLGQAPNHVDNGTDGCLGHSALTPRAK